MPNLLLTLFVLTLLACTTADEPALENTAPADAAPDLGVPCDGAADCVEDDPCVTSACVAGSCVLGRPEVEWTELPPIPIAGAVSDIGLGGDSLYVARGEDGIEVWDLTDFPAPPQQVLDRAREGDEGPAIGLAIGGERLILVEEGGHVRALDRQSGAPIGVPYKAGDTVRAVAFRGATLLLAAYAKGVELIEPGDWSSPQRVGRADTPGRAAGLARAGRLLAVADGLAGVALLDLPDEGPPTVRRDQRVETAGRVDSVGLAGQQLVLAEGGAGLGVVDLTAPPGRQRRSTTVLDGPAISVALLDGRTAVVAVGPAGWVVLDLLTPEAPAIWTRGAGGVARVVRVQGERVAVGFEDTVQVFERRCPEPEAAPDAGIP